MKSIWTGALSFGLINIPVRLYSATRDRALSFKLFDKKANCPVSYVRVCREDGKEIPYENIVKGYEYEKGEYVLLQNEDFKSALPEKTDQIEVVQFSDEQEIDPKYYEKSYYIEPEKKSAKAYILLRDALLKAKKVGIAKFVMRDKQHMAAVKPNKDFLMLTQLRYEDEILEEADLDISVPEKKKAHSEEELEIALALIKKLQKKFEPGKFHDAYAESLLKVIEAKAKGKRIKKSVKSPYSEKTEMKDLMKLLKKSLNKKP
ncbi:MAG: Ku protein [Candidatus Paceibacterota bacterium]|jgi:DNA end-binding protein Ku|nr:Ku protein [Candidatus Paceibacterota bacterium]